MKVGAEVREMRMKEREVDEGVWVMDEFRERWVLKVLKEDETKEGWLCAKERKEKD